MKAWTKRHPIWASVIGVFALLMVIGMIAGDPNSQSKSDSAAAEAGNDTQTVDATASTTPTPEPTPIPRVSLHVSRPSDATTVHAPTVRVTGRVTRGATVKVRGHEVAVTRGRFARTVALKRGPNAIKVEARKGAMRTARQSVRVTRKLSAAERARIAAKKAAARAAAIANYKGSATTIPYNQLNKNADRFKGKRVKYTGQILQIQEETGLGGFMLLSVTDLGYGIYDDNIWVDYDHSIRSAEDDIVTVYGTVTGSKSYDTQIGGETYVPRVHARYIEE